jgi:hypothetical protein
MPIITPTRLGHANHVAPGGRAAQERHEAVFGARTFAEWKWSAIGCECSLVLVGAICLEVFGVYADRGWPQQFVDRAGPGWHSIEWTVPSLDEAEERLRAEGIGITEVWRGLSKLGTEGGYLFIDPADCHGIALELTQDHFPGDPRDQPGWDPAWARQHPLGIEALHSVRLLVPEPHATAEWLGRFAGAEVVFEEPRPALAGHAVGVRIGGEVYELVGPRGDGPAREGIRAKGPGAIHSVTLAAHDADAAGDYLRSLGLPVEDGSVDGTLALAGDGLLGARYEFTTASAVTAG